MDSDCATAWPTSPKTASISNLVQELPHLLETMRSKASVTIGINLDNRLRPVATTLLAVNDQPFTSSSFIDRLLGRSVEDYKGIGPLHSVAALEVARNPLGLDPQTQPINPMLVPLFRDLAKDLGDRLSPDRPHPASIHHPTKPFFSRY